jgi:hypothetical protein
VSGFGYQLSALFKNFLRAVTFRTFCNEPLTFALRQLVAAPLTLSS